VSSSIRYQSRSGAEMPTRQGWLALVGSAMAFVIGRLFAVRELYIIGAALFIALVAGVVVVALTRSRVSVERHIDAEVLVVGDRGRVTVRITPDGRSPAFELFEPVGAANQARLGVGALAGPGSAAYLIPTDHRGVIAVGPMRAEKTDVLGLARHRQVLAPVEHIRVAPRALPVVMPTLGTGKLGQQLMVLARRLGLDEFHSLRDYVPGDEMRSIHWKASARSEGFKVKQHSHSGLRRCIVVFDPTVREHDTPAQFESAVTATASIVVASEQAGLSTRFVCADAVDARGPSVVVNTLEYLAIVEPVRRTEARPRMERDPGDGLGLVIVVCTDRTAPAWAATRSLLDPTLTVVGAFTDPAAVHGPYDVAIPTEQHFLNGWRSLVGSTRALSA